MSARDDADLAASGGNVRGDHQTEEPQAMRARAELARAIGAVLAERRLTSFQAAELLGVDESSASALTLGLAAGLSVDLLLHCLSVLGQDVEIAVKTEEYRGAHGRIRVVTDRGLTLADLRARREEILEIAAKHGARKVRVFGSVARGEARPGSDVDFVVELGPKRGALDLGELTLDLEELLGRPVDVVEIRRPSPTAERIQLEAIPL